MAARSVGERAFGEGAAMTDAVDGGGVVELGHAPWMLASGMSTAVYLGEILGRLTGGYDELMVVAEAERKAGRGDGQVALGALAACDRLVEARLWALHAQQSAEYEDRRRELVARRVLFLGDTEAEADRRVGELPGRPMPVLHR